jgi:hypothetical protein
MRSSVLHPFSTPLMAGECTPGSHMMGGIGDSCWALVSSTPIVCGYPYLSGIWLRVSSWGWRDRFIFGWSQVSHKLHRLGCWCRWCGRLRSERQWRSCMTCMIWPRVYLLLCVAIISSGLSFVDSFVCCDSVWSLHTKYANLPSDTLLSMGGAMNCLDSPYSPKQPHNAGTTRISK